MKNLDVYTLTITTEVISELFELVKKRKPTDAEIISVIKTVGNLNEKFNTKKLVDSILEYIVYKIALLPDD